MNYSGFSEDGKEETVTTEDISRDMNVLRARKAQMDRTVIYHFMLNDVRRDRKHDECTGIH